MCQDNWTVVSLQLNLETEIRALRCLSADLCVIVVNYPQPHTCTPVHALLFPDTHTQPFPEDNSCAVRWDCNRKSIYPNGVVLMTLPAGSLLLSFSLRAKTGSFCVAWTESRWGGRGGGSSGEGITSRQTAVTPHTAFSGHRLYFWHVSTDITHDASLLSLSPSEGCLLASQG